MCKFASFILTKNKEYWSSTSDSHEDIIQENKLKNLDRATPNLVRVEITPNEDSISDLDTWKFFLDQDQLPSWTFKGDPSLEERARKALKRRAQEEKWFMKETGQNVWVGYDGTAISGYKGTAKVGDFGTAKAGSYGTAISGFMGTSKAGSYGTAQAGKKGIIMIEYYDYKNIKRTLIEYVVENGVEPNTPYIVKDGKLVKK
jgi:hypothetical protein